MYKNPDYPKIYREKNKEKSKIYNRLWELEHRKERNKYRNEYLLKNKEKINNLRRKNRVKNREKINLRNRESNKKYYKNNREKIFNYIYNRIESDPIFKVKTRLRTRIYQFLKRKGKMKKCRFNDYIGCNPIELKIHLENQFVKNMNWANYGKWHIDHIVPLDSGESEEEIYKLCHYLNLQPLWAFDNISKGNKI